MGSEYPRVRQPKGKEAEIKRQLEESLFLKRYLQEKTQVLLTIAEQITQALREGNKVLLFGNGGSAADAQHIASELVGKFYQDRAPLPVIALTTNTSSLTAIANDYGYQMVFARQVRGLARERDVVIGISTSGKSANVISGLEEAKRCGAVTIALTGQGGKLKDLADYTLSIPSKDTARIQEAHITAGHIICYLVEDALFSKTEK
jgi:D-sedoheptulose 7-phosphate isomerase